MSCEGCFQSMRGQQEALQTIMSKAREYAKEIKKPVAIYKEGFEYRYIVAEQAIGRFRVEHVVSFHI